MPEKPGVVHRQAEQVELVLAVEDREIGLIAQHPWPRRRSRRLPMWWNVPAQTLRGRGPISDLQPPNHLPRRASGEGHQQDRLRPTPVAIR